MPTDQSTGPTPTPAAKNPAYYFNEFFENQEKFSKDMSKLNVSFNEMRSTIKKILSSEEMTTLENYFKPFADLTENPYPRGDEFASLSIIEKATLIQSQMRSDTANKITTALMAVEVNGNEAATFLKTINDKIEAYKNNKSTSPDDVKILNNVNLENTSSSSLIKSMQHLPRYGLLADAMQKSLKDAGLSAADNEKAKAITDDIKQHFSKVAITYNEKQRERELLRVADALKNYSGKNPKLKQLSADATNESDIGKRYAIISKAYINAYLDERTLTAAHTIKKSSYLKEFEKILSNSIDKYSDKPKADKFIFNHLVTPSPQVEKELTAHLFERAKAAINDNHQQVYVNAVKAVVRMGMQALQDWKKLVEATPGAEKMEIASAAVQTKDIRNVFNDVHAVIVKPKADVSSPASVTRKIESPTPSPRSSISSNSHFNFDTQPPPLSPRNQNTQGTSSILSVASTDTPLVPSRFDKGLLAEEKINKIKPILAAQGWSVSDVKSINHEALREVTKTTNDGAQKQFTISPREIKTQDSDLETFVTMLKCFEKTHNKMPVITTDNPALKDIWIAACKEVYPDKNLNFDKIISVKNAKSPEPAPEAPEPERPSFKR